MPEIPNGFYSGYFLYKGINYYSAVNFENTNYDEGASGGVIYQKNFATLSKGTFATYQDVIIFNPSKFGAEESKIWERNPDLVLSGTFRVVFSTSDSISFEKGTGERKIVYLLRRYSGLD